MKNLTLLLIGSGGREHALAWRLRQSPLIGRLLAAPGNAGIAEEAECVDLDPMDFDAVVALSRAQKIDLVVVGPEAPLAGGIVDLLEAEGIAAFGPTAAAARLESSKAFAKDLCAAEDIPTAEYRRFADPAAARAYLARRTPPFVIKADGLAAGKGVVIAESLDEAHAAIEAMLGGQFGQAGTEIVIEEFLEGEEASLFALIDGKDLILLPSAQDHKRAYDGDKGPNTGGMGAYSPAPVMTQARTAEAVERILKPTVAAMAARGTPFKGVLYAGLMLTADGPKLIEYNVRFGDPEAQVLMMRLKDDLVPALLAARAGRLAGTRLAFDPRPALTVVMAAHGYPGSYERGSVIGGLGALSGEPGLKVFHAGTVARDGAILANGGRVLNVTALGGDIAEARKRAYDAIARIAWPEGFFRHDIGWRALARD